MILTLAYLSLFAARPLQEPAPLVYAVQTCMREARLGGTAAQAAALARNPAYEGWTYRAQRWTISDKPPAGLPAADPVATQAKWDANPGVELRIADPNADLVGNLAPSLPGPPPLDLVGGDPSLGDQFRFEVRRRYFAGPEGEVRAALAAIQGPTGAGKWAAIDALLSDWTKPVVSATWPRLP